MENTLKKFQQNGAEVEIWYDITAPNPFKEFDEYTAFVSFLRRYDLTTGRRFNTPEEFLATAKREKFACFTPFYAYIHGGIVIRAGESNPFHCEWDSGFAGFAYITRESVRKLMGWEVITKKRKAELESYMLQDVEMYNSYLQGNVYGYTITYPNGEIDSCGGFYCDLDEVIEEAKSLC